MTDKKKAARQGSPSHNKTRPHSTSADSQELRLLAYLLAHDSGINRYEAERMLTICHLAGRVQGLEYRGCEFITTYGEAFDRDGHQHNGIARYWLKSGPLHLLKAANDSGVSQ